MHDCDFDWLMSKAIVHAESLEGFPEGLFMTSFECNA